MLMMQKMKMIMITRCQHNHPTYLDLDLSCNIGYTDAKCLFLFSLSSTSLCALFFDFVQREDASRWRSLQCSLKTHNPQFLEVVG